MAGGPYAKTLESRIAPITPSQIQTINGVYMTTARAMDKSDFRHVLQEYRDAAKRARAAGVDIITVHATEGAACRTSSCSGCTTAAPTSYGGRFENRARFAREAVEAVREGAGDDIAVTVRFTTDTLPEPLGLGELGVTADNEGGGFIEPSTTWWTCGISTSAPHSPGARTPHRSAGCLKAIARTGSGTRVPKRPSRSWRSGGRYTNPDSMVRAIESGILDIIGAARPSIADPFLPKKVEEAATTTSASASAATTASRGGKWAAY
jgi:dimethylamine/trimethylamine dehydrogenase